jgi:hypothetical protein
MDVICSKSVIMEPARHAFWTLIEEFAPSTPSEQRLEFVTDSAAIVKFIETHPKWDGRQIRAAWVRALVLDASDLDATFAWIVTEEGAELRFKPR